MQKPPSLPLLPSRQVRTRYCFLSREAGKMRWL